MSDDDEFDWNEEAISVEQDEAIHARLLTSVESVKVCPPPDRKELSCFIHGQISFNDDLDDNLPVILFDRPKDKPESIVLGHPDFGFLTLSDGGDSHRLLCAAVKPIFVNLKLYERLSSGDDVEIANIENFKYDTCLVDERVTFEVETPLKFTFQVSYAVMVGVGVQVEVRAIDYGGGVVPSKRDATRQVIPRKIPMWGWIAACQHFGNGEGGSSTITLNYRFDIEPMIVEIGSPISLDRKFVVAPVSDQLYLSVALALCSIESKVPDIVQDSIAFPIKLVFQRKDSALTPNRQLTYTKQLPGTMFSVSITLVP